MSTKQVEDEGFLLRVALDELEEASSCSVYLLEGGVDQFVDVVCTLRGGDLEWLANALELLKVRFQI